MTKTPLDDEGIRQALAEACAAAGGQRTWAASNGVSTSYLSDVLNAKKPPGDSITRALGYRRQVQYIPDHWEHQDDLKKGSKK